MQGAGMTCGEVLRNRRSALRLLERPWPPPSWSSAIASAGTRLDVLLLVPKAKGGDLETSRPQRLWELPREGESLRAGEPTRCEFPLSSSPPWRRRSREPLGVRILSSVTTSESEATFCWARASSSSKYAMRVTSVSGAGCGGNSSRPPPPPFGLCTRPGRAERCPWETSATQHDNLGVECAVACPGVKYGVSVPNSAALLYLAEPCEPTGLKDACGPALADSGACN